MGRAGGRGGLEGVGVRLRLSVDEQLSDFSTFSPNRNAQKRSNFVVRYAPEFNTKFLKSRFKPNVM